MEHTRGSTIGTYNGVANMRRVTIDVSWPDRHCSATTNVCHYYTYVLVSTDDDPVFERLDYYFGGGRHDLTSPSGKANGESLLERASVAACRRGCQTASSR